MHEIHSAAASPINLLKAQIAVEINTLLTFRIALNHKSTIISHKSKVDAAGDLDALAADPAGVFATKESYYATDIVGLSYPAEGCDR